MSMSECEASLEDALRRYGDMVPDDVAKAARALIREHRADDARAGRGGVTSEHETRLREWMESAAPWSTEGPSRLDTLLVEHRAEVETLQAQLREERDGNTAKYEEIQRLCSAVSSARDAALEEAATREMYWLSPGDQKAVAARIRALKSASATVCGEVSTVEGGRKLGSNSGASTAEEFASVRAVLDGRRGGALAFVAALAALTRLELRMGATAEALQGMLALAAGTEGHGVACQCPRCSAARGALTGAPGVLPADRVREVLAESYAEPHPQLTDQEKFGFRLGCNATTERIRYRLGLPLDAEEKTCAGCGHCESCVSAYQEEEAEAREPATEKGRLPGPRSAADRHRRDAAGCLPDCPACASEDA